MTTDRMRVQYRITGAGRAIAARAAALAVEQSIEMPVAAVRNARVREELVGRVEEILDEGRDVHRVTISLALETTGGEAGQLLNMLFGNSSLHPDLRLVDFDLPDTAAAAFGGPRFGIGGWRAALGIGRRPLTCSALKPQGCEAAELAALAGQLASAGIDLIKDDHGLADQASAPFARRVAAVQRAVDDANRATGRACLYAPALNGGSRRIQEQLGVLRDEGVGAVLIAPMIAGLGTLQELASQGRPILAHPALAGHGAIAAPLLLGKLFRLAGADAVIYPHFGGRFGFSADLCRSIADTARQSWLGLAPTLPVPAGGMHPDRVEELVAGYGPDVMLLIGGALLEADDVRRAARAFVTRVAALETDR